MKTCPKCSAQNSSDAWLCSCGYEFTSGEPHLESPIPKADLPSERIPVVTLAAILTLIPALFLLAAYCNGSHLNFEAVIITLALAFFGFVSLLFCLRILVSPDLGWVIKLLSILFIVLGVVLLGSAIVWGGCTTGVFRFRMNN